MDKKPIRVALVDDHKLFRKGMVELVDGFPGYKVVLEANDGDELVQQLSDGQQVEVVLLDIKMKNMDGYATAAWLKTHHPSVKVLALSMYGDEQSIIKMLKGGAKGYILKDADPEDLHKALDELVHKGFFHTELVGNALLGSIHHPLEGPVLNEKETEFMRLACTELTYKEIADRMCLSPRTIDGYRENLFEKLAVKNRVGLVIYAIKNGIFLID